jgi:hypothetical protein
VLSRDHQHGDLARGSLACQWFFSKQVVRRDITEGTRKSRDIAEAFSMGEFEVAAILVGAELSELCSAAPM